MANYFKDIESTSFLLRGVGGKEKSLEIVLQKIGRATATATATASRSASLATLTFIGVPEQLLSTSYLRVRSQNPLSKIKLRIARDGTTPWEYLDVKTHGKYEGKLPAIFRSRHIGFRVEILATEHVAPGDIVSIFLEPSRIAAQAQKGEVKMNFPRLLMIDSTPLGHGSATGQLKKMFLEEWPEDSFLQIWGAGGKDASAHVLTIGQNFEDSKLHKLSTDEIVEKCVEFAPDVVYFRPVDSEMLFDLTHKILTKLDQPLVLHMMDDWLMRTKAEHPEKFAKFEHDFRRLVKRADTLLSIGAAMSAAYALRYGGEWIPLANGVDLASYPKKEARAYKQLTRQSPFVIRYMGGLAEDMGYASVKDIAQAVAQLQIEHPVRLEIFTMDWYRAKAEAELACFPGVTVSGLVSLDKYEKTLCEADALLIAYNFDEKSLAYVRYSLANKLPECFASGVPLLAYGPTEVATIEYLEDSQAAVVVSQRNPALLRNALEKLITQPSFCHRLGESARLYAEKNLAKQMVQKKFRETISVASSIRRNTAQRGIESSTGAVAEKFLGQNQSNEKKRIKTNYWVYASSAFNCISENMWRYTAMQTDKQELWLAIFDQVCLSGSCFKGYVRIKASCTVTLRVTLGRHGNSVYEGDMQEVVLEAGIERSIDFRTIFANEHQALKLQVEVKQLLESSVDLSIAGVQIRESISSLFQRLSNTERNLQAANRMFREKDYATSIAINAELYTRRPLKMYTENALRAAKQMGFVNLENMEEILRVLD